MSKVAPMPSENVTLGAERSPNVVAKNRSSRVFRAVNDAYEFSGWPRIWLAVIWFIAAILTVTYHYPTTAGTFHSNVKALMTSYEPSPGANNADVRSQNTFSGGLSHALEFLAANANRATADRNPEGLLPITEYDQVMFARLEIDFKTNCKSKYSDAGFQCYTNGTDPGTGFKLDAEQLAALAGPDGFRQFVLFDRGTTRAELLARMAQVKSQELAFISAYAFRAVVQLGVVNELASYYRTTYLFTISRESSDSIGSQALREVVVAIDNVDVRTLPLYTEADDYVRAFFEVLTLLFLFRTIWDEVIQFNTVRAWRGLHLTEAELQDKKAARKRLVHLTWFFFAQPWNVVDAITIINYGIWWIVYIVIVVRSYKMEIKIVDTVADYDAMKEFADSRLMHLVWGVFSAVLIGLRVLPQLKTHGGLRVYSATLKLSWHRLKDFIVFFGYVGFLVVTLMSPMFEITGANPRFKDTGTALLNAGLMTLQYMSFTDYFADDAPTFGEYKLIFMFMFWALALVLVIIAQNILLALVASSYEEAREAEGAVERTHFTLSVYRLWWMAYSRWHRWILRKSAYTLFEELLVTTRNRDVWFYQHVFVRWALADLPETRLLAQLYTDPASEIIYMYSPWAWARASPWDTSQVAPWDEQLDYPMYGWADVPVNNSPGAKPRLLRMPPLFTAGPANGRSAARSRMPSSYSEADSVFSMTEQEVCDLLECVEDCWQRIRRYSLVARFAGLGWSQRGHELLREGLLEVYRRHRVGECTTTAVKGAKASSSKVEEEQQPASVKSAAGLDVEELHSDGSPLPGSGKSGKHAGAAVESSTSGNAATASSAVAAQAAYQRNRQFSMFNRRGRIADNLDLMWGELSEVRQQQQEIKDLLVALLELRGGGAAVIAAARAAGDGGVGGQQL